MLSVTSYKHVEKKNAGEAAFLEFLPLRAVGLCVELCWKLVRDRGFGALGVALVRKVEVGGELRVLSEGKWRSAQRCTLELALRDAALAVAVVKRQSAILNDLGINVWQVDTKPQGSASTFDLLCCFHAGSKNYGVAGKLWVEIKVVTARRFDEDVATWRAQLEVALHTEHARDPDLQGVLLLVASVAKGAGGQWAAPAHFAYLKALSSDSWVVLAGAAKKTSRGKCQTQKPPLQTVLDKMEWHTAATGSSVGLLRDFLRAFGLPVNNAGQRAETFNQLLRQSGCKERIKEVKLANKTGRKPWVGSKRAFRELYKHV
jgi:hypothetical protein